MVFTRVGRGSRQALQSMYFIASIYINRLSIMIN